MRRTIAAVALALLAAAPLRAQTQVLIVGGLGGEPKFVERFRMLGAELSGALHARFGIPDASIAWLGEDSTSRDPRYRGPSTRAAVEKQIEAIKARCAPGSQVVIIFIGHGAGTEAESRISLPGPDVTVADVKRWIDGFPQQRLAFVNLTSASGDFLPIIAAPGRVVITATKTGFERNESRFAEFFVKALSQDVADVDKDSRVSLLEAFRYAARETKRVYDDATKLQTEHSQLDDAEHRRSDGSRRPGDARAPVLPRCAYCGDCGGWRRRPGGPLQPEVRARSAGGFATVAEGVHAERAVRNRSRKGADRSRAQVA